MERYLSAKSVHNYAWAFRIQKEVKNFRKDLEAVGYVRKPMDSAGVALADNVGTREWQNIYMLNQYLSTSAREIFVDKADKVCAIYQLPNERLKDLYYYIDAVWSEYEKGKEVQKEKKYYLPIDQVEIHVFYCGVAIMFLQVLNEDKQSSIEDIKKINDLGRRISLPYLLDEEVAKKQWSKSIVAKQLGIIKADKKEEFKILKVNIVDFQQKNLSFLNKGEYVKDEMQFCTPFLMDILNGYPLGNLEERRITKDNIGLHADDRLYVMSLIRDKTLSDEIEEEKWVVQAEDEENRKRQLAAQEKYYSIIFIDPTHATCRNAKMRERLLEESIYPRWLGWGSLYAVTNYSMLCITGESPSINDSVVKPFLEEYKYIVSLVLAQKMGIERFAIETGKLAEESDRVFWYRKMQNLFKLQKKFVVFLNQMMIIEVSCQEQGVEIYNMVQKQMMIEQEIELLDKQLTGLYNMADVSRSKLKDFLVNLFTIVLPLMLALPLGQTMSKALEDFIWPFLKALVGISM